jgi:hypothetical protein
MRHLAFLLGITVAATLCAQPAAAAASLKDRLPEETYGYVYVRDVPAFVEKVKASLAYRFLSGVGALDGPAEMRGAPRGRKLWETYIEPATAFVDGEIVIGILPPRDGDVDVRGVILADVSGEAFEAYLRDVIMPIVEERELPLEVHESAGLTMTRIGLDTDEHEELVLTCTDGLVVVAESVDDVLQFVHAQDAAGLTALNAYADLRRATGQNDVEIFVDLRKLSAGRGSGDVEAEPRRAWLPAGGDFFMLWGASLGPHGGSSVLRIKTPAPPGGVLSVLGREGEPAKSPRYLPEAVHTCVVLRASSLLDLWRGGWRSFLQIGNLPSTVPPEVLVPVARIEEDLGMRLDPDLLGALGGEIAVAAGSSSAGPGSLALLVEVKDRDVARKVIEWTVGLIGSPDGKDPLVASHQHRGIEIREVSPTPSVKIVWAFAGDFLVIGTAGGFVEEIIDTYKGESALAESERFKALVSRLGGMGTLTVYSDLRALPRLYAGGKLGKRLGAGQLARLLEMLVAEDAPPLPFAGALSGDEHGITYRHVSRFELAEPVAAVSWWMLLSALANAPNEEAVEDQGVDEDAGRGAGADAAVQCPACGHSFVPDGSDPDRVVCPKCGALITGFE